MHRPHLADRADASAPYQQFDAPGYVNEVVGELFDRAHPASQGMPLGGIGTGCLDLATDGTLGFVTIFNSLVPRRGPLNLPLLGISEGETMHVLSTRPFTGLDLPGQHAYRTANQVRFAEDIVYWGHYPAADLTFRTRTQVQVRLRAWAPFLPGDLVRSSAPIAFFDVDLVNPTDQMLTGQVVLNFPGPDELEAGGPSARHTGFSERYGEHRFDGVRVGVASGEYTVAAVDCPDVHWGAPLGVDGGRWRRATGPLSPTAGSLGVTVAARYAVGPGESQRITFTLAWHFPTWNAAGSADPDALAHHHGYNEVANDAAWRSYAGSSRYQHMYATHYRDATAVFAAHAGELDALRDRVVAWQDAVYRRTELPDWLRDGLINSLHLLTETAVWASAQSIGEWCDPKLGLFGLNEDPRNCPQIECVPCSFYGNYPLVYFFPDLARSTLLGYRQYQFDNGEVAWIFGGMTARPPTRPYEMTRPDRGYQTALNGACVVDMVYRYWKCTGDQQALAEVADLVRRATEFTMSLRAEDGSAGVISFPAGDSGLDWFEACTWAGMAAHLGGIHLAQLAQSAAIADAAGDPVFADRCRNWLREGSQVLEANMWLGTHYINYWDQSTGERSDLVMANQLDGLWMSRMAGLPDVFDTERAMTVLETVRRTCVEPHPHGAVNFADLTGRATTSGEGRPGWNYNPYAFFVPETIMLAATYLYAGHTELGLDLARRCWTNLCTRGLLWDQPNLLNAATGEPIYGNDYYQNMIIWALPPALAGRDVASPLEQDGLVNEILRSASTALATTP